MTPYHLEIKDDMFNQCLIGRVHFNDYKLKMLIRVPCLDLLSSETDLFRNESILSTSKFSSTKLEIRHKSFYGVLNENLKINTKFYNQI